MMQPTSLADLSEPSRVIVAFTSPFTICWQALMIDAGISFFAFVSSLFSFGSKICGKMELLTN